MSRAPRPHEGGFTLVELLVVVALMVVIGGAITNVVVTTTQTSRTNSDVRAKLDQTRLAIERVREELRGADEVCSQSAGTSVAIWTDLNGDGDFQVDEMTTFSVVTVDGMRVLQRQDGTSPPRGIVGNIAAATAYFAYDLPPAQQPTSLRCRPTLAPTGAGARTQQVELDFPITASRSGDPANATDMTVSTSITLRNAVHGVVSATDAGPAPENAPPIASFTYSCASLTCSFASTSTDPDGDVMTQRWDLGDHETSATQSLLPSFTHAFPAEGTYTVTLHVRDHHGLVASTFQNVSVFAPVEGIMFVSDLDDVSSRSTNGNFWTPAVEVQISSGHGQPLVGATVQGIFDLTGSAQSCVTGTDGRCQMVSTSCVTAPGHNAPSCPETSSNTMFTVTDVTRSGYAHDPDRATDPDADNSDGLSIDLVLPNG